MNCSAQFRASALPHPQVPAAPAALHLAAAPRVSLLLAGVCIACLVSAAVTCSYPSRNMHAPGCSKTAEPPLALAGLSIPTIAACRRPGWPGRQGRISDRLPGLQVLDRRGECPLLYQGWSTGDPACGCPASLQRGMPLLGHAMHCAGSQLTRSMQVREWVCKCAVLMLL